MGMLISLLVTRSSEHSLKVRAVKGIKVEDGRTLYLVEWEAESDFYSWEPEDKLSDTDMEAFWQELANLSPYE